ncbi:MAG: T9SS type A sorting domain-containing protein [Ignavibacteriales bacterium]|nr:T9SS type A sorting domain-containing protein [Ignavibacteriales bacterium]
MFDDGTNGDATSGDGIFTVVLNFPKYSPIQFEHKYGINYGDAANNQGGNDNENGVGANHITVLDPTWTSCTVIDTFGSMGVSVITDGLGIEGEEMLPIVYSLEQNFPNPFNPSTSIKFSIPEAGFVTLKIYNLLGQEVATLVKEQMNAGTREVKFNASNLASGIYIYRLEANNFTSTKKMVLLK